MRFFTKFGDKYLDHFGGFFLKTKIDKKVQFFTKFGDGFRESPNLVTIYCDHFGESFLETKLTGNIVQTLSPNSVMIFGSHRIW